MLIADVGGDGVAALLGLLAYGVLSALVPVFNAEAVAAVVGGTSRHWVVGIAALTLGTTVGKVIILMAARRGAEWLERWKARQHRRSAARAAAKGPRGPWSRRLERWGSTLLQHLDRPLVSGLVVLASAAVGIPPLAVVAVLAGMRRTPVAVFAMAVFVGRMIRFVTVAAPFAAAAT